MCVSVYVVCKDYKSGLGSVAEICARKTHRMIFSMRAGLTVSGQPILCSRDLIGLPMSVQKFTDPQYLSFSLELPL